MRKKQQLLLALKALSAVPITFGGLSAVAQDSTEKAGVAGSVRPTVEGQVSGDSPRVLLIGSDVFRNETISTGPGGSAHLLFADKSSLTLGPNSEIVIDRFVYQPETGSGELTISTGKGVLRFVGGALSKSGSVGFNTPLGTLGIRGGVVMIEIDPDTGEITASLIFGDELELVQPGSNDSVLLRQLEHFLRMLPDGTVDTGPMDVDELNALIELFAGPPGEPVSWPGLAVPDNYLSWLRELAVDADQNTLITEENIGLVISS